MNTWISNNPQAVKALNAADTAYEAAKLAATELPLREKVAALRNAKAARQRAYGAVITEPLGQ